MKRLIWFLSVACLLVALSACSNGNKNSNDNDGIPEIIEVELTVPEKADVDENIHMKATVAQGSEDIKDADEVTFEIWEEGKKEESEMIEAVNAKDGSYSAETSFDHDGLFTVQVHVTARGQHSMPKSSVVVGEGAVEHEGHEEHDHSHGDNNGFSMHFMKPEDVAKGKESALVLHIEDEAGPMEKARVRFEIWNEAASEKHDWLEGEETKAGEYSSTYTFEETGTYSIQIHVENDHGLHEHEVHEIEVK